jgi:putative ABC transport system permease protein
MMPAPITHNRQMFWRIVGRLLASNYSRLFVILLALGSGAAITAALLNLQVDTRSRLTTEFRSLGANVILSSPVTLHVENKPFPQPDPTIDESILAKLPSAYQGKPIPAAAFLYVIGAGAKQGDTHFVPVVVAGIQSADLPGIFPGMRWQSSAAAQQIPDDACAIGGRIAAQFRVDREDRLTLRDQGREFSCRISAIFDTGGPEDSQIFVNLPAAQSLANLPGRISLVQLSVNAAPESLRSFLAALSAQLPGVDVRGVKQIAEAEGQLFGRISGLLTATVVLVLLLTSLCVMAGMSNVAIERKNDVGLMKAIGGSVRRVTRFFLAEAALAGLAGGLIGSAIGLAFSVWLGKAVFGVAAQPRWIVYPLSVALTVVVSIAGSFPLRRLASIRPAAVFRGEA